VVYIFGLGVLEFKLPPSQLLIGCQASFSLVKNKTARGKLWQNLRDEHQNIINVKIS